MTHEPFHPLNFPVESLTGANSGFAAVLAGSKKEGPVFVIPYRMPSLVLLFTGEFDRGVITPNQLRWRPFAIPSDSVDFVRGLTTICGAGSAGKKDGFAIHVYTASISMHNSCLANADGDMLIVPQQGMPTCCL